MDAFVEDDIKPVGVRIRPDLVYSKRSGADEDHWVVKDPVTLRYFHFGSNEITIMRWIDGRTPIAEIKRKYEQDYAPQKISTREIIGFCHGLHQRGLLIGSSDNQAGELLKRDREQQWYKMASLPLQVLSIRFPGVDPERFLEATRWAIEWIFYRWAVATLLTISLAVFLLGALNAESVMAKLPEQSHFFRGENLVFLLVTLAITKVFHELGHAYCCKYHGGECHQIGVLLMVFAPAMYCDVSDAWLFAKRSARIFVSVAGMYVEILIATVAFGLWYFAEPGFVSEWLLNIVFVCGVSTVLVNANPLLRYDGYYILSDLLDIPNLSARANQVLWLPLRRWFFPEAPAITTLETRIATLRTYAIAAVVYRTMIFGLILWFLYKASKQNDILPLWHTVVLLFLGGLLMRPAISFGTWFMKPKTSRDRISKLRVAIALVILAAVCTGVGMIPIPTRVHVPVVADLHADHRVYVQVEGILTDAVAAGSKVAKGQPIARLANKEIENEIIEIEGLIAQAKQKLSSLELRSNNSPEAASQIPTARSALDDLKDRLLVASRRRNHLTILAPHDGKIIQAPKRLDERPAKELMSRWVGDPLDPSNRGCFLERGELLCFVGNPKDVHARVIVNQDQVELIRSGDPIHLLFDGTSLQSVPGKITGLSTDLQANIPRVLTTVKSLSFAKDAQGELQLADGAFTATAEFDTEGQETILPGSVGRAVIVGRTQTVWQYVARFVQLNFRFVR